MKQAAYIISVLFHPLLMPTYACLMLFYGFRNSIFELMTSNESKWQIIIIVFTFTFLLPMLNIFLMFKLKRITSLILSNRHERTFPYLMTAIFYFGLFYLFFDLRIWQTIKIFIFCAGTAILLTALINLKYKISAHMVGIGGLLGMVFSLHILLRLDLTGFIAVTVLAAGLTGSARLILNEHKPSQIYTGFLMGFLCQTILFLPLQQLTLNY
jgi:hypothetical protein